MLRSKIITAALVIAIVAALVVGCNEFSQWATHKVKQDALDIQSQFTNALSKVKNQVYADLNNLNESLISAANQLSNIDLQGSEANNILSQLTQSNDFIVNSAICDANDILVSVQPSQYNSIIGQDISNQKQNIIMHQTLKPSMSNLTRLVEGFPGVVMVAPIFDGSNSLKGSLSIVIQPSQIINASVTSKLSGTAFKCWAVQTNGTILFDQNATKIGSPLYLGTVRFGNFTINTSTRNVLRNSNGTIQYNVPTPNAALGNYVREQCYWTTVSMYNTSWRIAVIRDISR
jgi:hypothetical protein